MHEDFRNYVEELLTDQPCPVDTWIHLLNCPRCSQELEAIRKVSSLFSHSPQALPQTDPLFYIRVQARISQLRLQSPWRSFVNTGLAKRVVLTCLACTGLLASYLLSSSSEENNTQILPRTVELTNLEASDPPAQRDAVLVNFVLDSRSADDVPR